MRHLPAWTPRAYHGGSETGGRDTLRRLAEWPATSDLAASSRCPSHAADGGSFCARAHVSARSIKSSFVPLVRAIDTSSGSNDPVSGSDAPRRCRRPPASAIVVVPGATPTVPATPAGAASRSRTQAAIALGLVTPSSRQASTACRMILGTRTRATGYRRRRLDPAKPPRPIFFSAGFTCESPYFFMPK